MEQFLFPDIENSTRIRFFKVLHACTNFQQSRGNNVVKKREGKGKIIILKI